MDAETEALVMEALAHLTKGRKVFVIAHRSTIRRADEIVLERGEIVECGTHEQLLASAYRRFHDARVGRSLILEGRERPGAR